MRNREGVEYEMAAAIICGGSCGLVPISPEEELRQLNYPDRGWICPRCGSEANWDDNCPMTNPPEDKP